jgi:hypothetical protein
VSEPINGDNEGDDQGEFGQDEFNVGLGSTGSRSFVRGTLERHNEGKVSSLGDEGDGGDECCNKVLTGGSVQCNFGEGG